MTKFNTKAYGASGKIIIGKILEPIDVEREKPKADEVLIEVLFCGVCHSDIHQVNNDWKNTLYPCVPGHEIIGKIIETGPAVTKLKTGDIVGVGCMIDSCQECRQCKNGDEQFCQGPHGMTMTYNGYWKPDATKYNTFGGYSTHIVANQDFILRIPDGLDISATAPILCAGVTTYSPLKHRGIKTGDKVGIIGIGGLGHMAVMIAKAMGAHVTAITTKQRKINEALELGADAVLTSEDKIAMGAHETAFDFLLCTIPYEFDLNPYISLLAPRGSIVTVGLLGPYKKPTNNMEMAKYSRSAGASIIGSIAETQEVLDFCAQHHILPHVEMINIKDINEIFEKIKNDEARFRYVIDMSTLE